MTAAPHLGCFLCDGQGLSTSEACDETKLFFLQLQSLKLRKLKLTPLCQDRLARLTFFKYYHSSHHVRFSVLFMFVFFSFIDLLLSSCVSFNFFIFFCAVFLSSLWEWNGLIFLPSSTCKMYVVSIGSCQSFALYCM